MSLYKCWRKRVHTLYETRNIQHGTISLSLLKFFMNPHIPLAHLSSTEKRRPTLQKFEYFLVSLSCNAIQVFLKETIMQRFCLVDEQIFIMFSSSTLPQIQRLLPIFINSPRTQLLMLALKVTRQMLASRDGETKLGDNVIKMLLSHLQSL